MSQELTDTLLDAALLHVAFDGWTAATFQAALTDTAIDPVVAQALFPRGALDLAVAYHRRGDALMEARLADAPMEGMRFRDKVALAVRTRLEVIDDKEAVRRGSTLFALPQHAAEGAKLVWGTSDRIWTVLGDTSEDHNWYTKRMTLSAVYSATVLYWLGDDSLDHQASWAFLDRRIDNVMQIEKLKGQARSAPGLGKMVKGLESVLSRVKPPAGPRSDVPGTQGAPQ